MPSLRLALLLVLLAVPLAGAEPDPAALRAEAWGLPAAYTSESGSRAKALLNGFWIRSAADGGGARQVRVPDWEGGKEGQVLWREVEVPAAWAGRRLFLRGPAAKLALAWDGQPAVHDADRGFALGPAVPGWHRLEVRAPKLTADCWLHAEPDRPAIADAYLRTLFRGGPTARLMASGQAAPGARLVLACTVSASADGPAQRTFSAACTADSDGAWAAEPSSPWDLELWSRWQPSLYWFTATLATADGTLVDRTLPQRFGFKEGWIEDGRLLLNGVPTTVVGDTCTRWAVWVFQKDGNLNVEQARARMRLFKSFGLTGLDTAGEALCSLADETGWLTHGSIGGLVRQVNVWDPGSGLTRMEGGESEADIVRNVRRLRQHPSVVGYEVASVYSLGMMHPELIGRPYPTWEHFPLNRSPERSRDAYQASRRAIDLARPADPDRWVNLPDGPQGVYDGNTRYLCDNLDLQECEEYFDVWHRGDRPKAVGLSEYGIPFDGHLFLRRIDHQMPQAGRWPPIHVENAARWFGDGVYGDEDDDRLRAWPTQGYAGTLRSPVTQRLQAMSVTAYLRAWRTYGIDLYGHHMLDNGAWRAREALPSGPGAADPRIPGYSRPAPLWSLGDAERAPWNDMGRAYLAAAAPLLAYIGGPDGRFTAKDHLFTAGARVRKAVVVVNDYDAPVPVRAAWSLHDAAGRQVAGGEVAATVAPGARELRALTIAFDAPAVAERSDFVLRVACAADRPGTLTDEFRLTVFPPAPPSAPAFRGTVWTLNISDDLTHETPHFTINRENAAFLAAAGVKARLLEGLREFTWEGAGPTAAAALHDPVRRPPAAAGRPVPGDLLIIPRHTLAAGLDDRQTCLRLLESLDLDRRIAEGLDVLVLEQDLANVFGVNTEDTRPRRVFPAAEGHPVLAGLAAGDFSYWGGDSDLQDAITPATGAQRRFPDRVYHVSNRNAVASRTFIRPQVGACRALLVSGFDLQESPLLEITRGKGRLILCSLDVTSRYGSDPVATRVVDNLLRYLAEAPRPDPAVPAVEALAPGVAGVAATTALRLPRPAGVLGWGIAAGDLFLRERIFAPGDFPAFADGQVVRRQDGTVQTTLAPERFATGWNRRKAAWVRAALTVNGGGSSDQGPGLGHHGRQLDLYPHPWVEGFVHPYTADIW